VPAQKKIEKKEIKEVTEQKKKNNNNWNGKKCW